VRRFRGPPISLSRLASSKISSGISGSWVSRYSRANSSLYLLPITLQPLEVRGPDDFEPAFSAIRKEHASAIIVLRNVITYTYGTRIVDLTAKSRLPAMYPDRVLVDTGGLMSYGPNFLDMFRRAATYVDKILKGPKPADLPVEMPTKFEFVINLKTAKQIGLTIPQSVLYRADKVIK
jgi:putative ABC transport system substrate-binding protein